MIHSVDVLARKSDIVILGHTSGMTELVDVSANWPSALALGPTYGTFTHVNANVPSPNTSAMVQEKFGIKSYVNARVMTR